MTGEELATAVLRAIDARIAPLRTELRALEMKNATLETKNQELANRLLELEATAAARRPAP
ncbi:MAG TPA: hypothetical protein VKE69_02860 [Planctomycetota bacterium]|nr:hypothetical protein [Planctomycetota bacterium]